MSDRAKEEIQDAMLEVVGFLVQRDRKEKDGVEPEDGKLSLSDKAKSLFDELKYLKHENEHKFNEILNNAFDKYISGSMDKFKGHIDELSSQIEKESFTDLNRQELKMYGDIVQKDFYEILDKENRVNGYIEQKPEVIDVYAKAEMVDTTLPSVVAEGKKQPLSNQYPLLNDYIKEEAKERPGSPLFSQSSVLWNSEELEKTDYDMEKGKDEKEEKEVELER